MIVLLYRSVLPVSKSLPPSEESYPALEEPEEENKGEEKEPVRQAALFRHFQLEKCDHSHNSCFCGCQFFWLECSHLILGKHPYFKVSTNDKHNQLTGYPSTSGRTIKSRHPKPTGISWPCLGRRLCALWFLVHP